MGDLQGFSWCRGMGGYWVMVRGEKRGQPLMLRLLFKVVVDDNGCWVWKGKTTRKGYGSIGLNYKIYVIHRVMFEYWFGKINPQLTIDHLCRNRACVNPLHLEEVTSRENVLRGIGPTAVNSRKTHCIHGHEFTPENTYRYGNYRGCKICRKKSRDISNKKRYKN